MTGVIITFTAMADFPNRINELRRERRWSQQKLAERAGLAYGTVRAIETGAVVEPGVFTIDAIAQVLDVTITELLQDM